MAAQHLDLPLVNRITVGAEGLPGQRIFYLQASDALSTITLKIEKEQARLLAQKSLLLLEEIKTSAPATDSGPVPTEADLALVHPLEPLFAVGQIGLGYDAALDKIILIMQEMVENEAEEASSTQFRLSRAQLSALSQHTLALVEQGRPTCPLCGRPIDPDGHFCPQRNGHNKNLQ